MPLFNLDIFIHNEKLSVSLFESGDSAHSYDLIGYDREEIHVLALALRTVLEQNGPQGSRAVSSAHDLEKCGLLLFDKLLSPGVKTRLRTLSDHDLILRIDEDLAYIPWELLFDGEMFLCLRFSLSRCMRTQTAIMPRTKKESGSPWRVLIIADTKGDLPAAALESAGIRQELKSVANLAVTTKTGNVLSQFLCRHIRDFDIVHFAGHVAYDNENALKSGWVFVDGRITAKDFMALGAGQPYPSVVFMNACSSDGLQLESGNDQQERQRASLAQALFLSGVRCVIATRNRLADKSAHLLACHFYRGLAKGLSVATALRQARVFIRQSVGPNDLTWAGYILYGFMAGLRQETPNVSHPKVGYRGDKKFFLKRSVVFYGLIGALLWVVFLGAGPAISQVLFRYRLHKAQSLAQAGRFELSVHAYSSIINSSPGYTEAAYELGRIYLRSKQNSKAVDVFTKGLAQAEEKKNIYWSERFGIALLEAHFLEGQNAQVLHLASRWSAGNVKDTANLVTVYRLAGTAAALLQQFSQADEWFIKAGLLCDEILCAERLSILLLRADNMREALLMIQVDQKFTLPGSFTVSAVELLYENAAALALAAGNISTQARAIAGLAALADGNSNIDKAAGFYTNAVGLWSSMGDMTDTDRCHLMLTILDIADIQVRSFQNFSEVSQAIQRVRKIAPSVNKMNQAVNGLWLLVQRRYEVFLQNVAEKGYKNSALYQEAVSVYAEIF